MTDIAHSPTCPFSPARWWPFLLLAFVPALAWPQSPADITALQPLEVRANRPGPERVGNTTRLDAADFENRRPGVLPEMLEAVPGVFLQQTTPGQGIAIIRGLKGSEVLHRVDGMRLNFGFLRNAPNQYLALVDPQALSRVEVSRGPGAAHLGADAMGGVIDMISHRAGYARGAHTENALAVGMNSAAVDESLQVHTRWDHRRERLGLTVGASARQHGPRTNGRGAELPFTGYQARAADANLRLAPRADQEWSLTLQHLRQPSTPRHDQLVAGFGQTEPERAEFFFEPSQRDFAHLRVHFDDAISSADHLQINLAWQRMIDDTRRRNLDSNQRDREFNRSELLGLTLAAEDRLTAAHTLRYGIELYHDRIASRAERIDIDSGATTERESRFPDGSTMRHLDAYVQHLWQGERTAIDAGLRVSEVDVDLRADGARDAFRLRREDLSGHLQASWTLTPRLALSGRLGRGVRTPNVFDLGAIGPRPGGRFNAPNPNLRNETIHGADLGLHWREAAQDAEITLWWAEYRDKIVSVDTGELTDNGETIVRSDNLGRVELRGAELLWRWRPAPAWHVRIVGATVWGAERVNGRAQAADRIPPVQGHATVSYRSRADHRFRLGLHSAGRQERLSPRDRADPRINPQGTAGWARVEAQARFRLPGGLDLLLAVDNILDQNYRRHGSGVDAPGRDYRAGLYWRWESGAIGP
ncbi:MAG: TonB-dependent receptor [Oceanococcaceae bacterium]